MWSVPLWCVLLFWLGYLREEVGTPQLQNLGQDLVDGEHLELVQPILDGLGDGGISVKGHDVGHILEDFQILDLQLLRAVIPVLIGLLQPVQVLEDVLLELDERTLETKKSRGIDRTALFKD